MVINYAQIREINDYAKLIIIFLIDFNLIIIQNFK